MFWGDEINAPSSRNHLSVVVVITEDKNGKGSGREKIADGPFRKWRQPQCDHGPHARRHDVCWLSPPGNFCGALKVFQRSLLQESVLRNSGGVLFP